MPRSYYSIKINPDLMVASRSQLTLGVIVSNVVVQFPNSEITQLMESASQEIKDSPKESYIGIEALKSTYKTLGLKSSYVGSNEALYKRIVTDKGLYHVNSVVDINNYMSIKSLRSIGSYDLAKLYGDIEFRCGTAGESYVGTTKRSVDLNKLPVLCDARGPFGSPTSDSDKALIKPSTSKLMTVIFSFDGDEQLREQLEEMVDLLQTHAEASNTEVHIVHEDQINFEIGDIGETAPLNIVGQTEC